ncbi:MAG: S8 family serine peptidase [Acidobacteriota bacterium]
MEPHLTEVFESGSPDDEVGVILRMANGVAPPPNVRVVAGFDDIFTARVRRGDIVLVRQSPGVVSLKASSVVTMPPPVEGASAGEDYLEEIESTDEATTMRAQNAFDRSSVPEDGRGVVVGICDWGFDFTHPNFRNADGTTRLLCLWDQRGFGDPLAPAPYNQGRLLTRDAINAALASPDPPGTLGYHPASGDPTNTGSHGTHVADILAGNRREPGSEVGLASAADLVFVHLATPHLDELGNLGDSVGLLEGLDFCRRQAAGRPCVLHLSAGKTGGEKRGQSPLERAVDTMLKAPSVVLVQSVGNYAHTAMHTHARIGPDQRHVLNWIIPENDRTPNELEIWYSGEDVFEVTLIAPDGSEFTVPLDDRKQLGDGLGVWGNFYHRLHEPNSGLNHIVVYLYRVAPSGMWRVSLHGRDVVDGRLHAWIERDASGRFQSRFLESQATSRYTTNTICNCYRAIAVGAYDGTRRDRPPTRFSSRGPTADGRQKPEVAAPGYMIRAARSLPRNGWQGNQSRLCVKSGTSMAAPWVSGTVALMMQAAGRPMTIHEIRRALVGSVDPHPGPRGRSSTRLGYGYLNVEAAVAAARRLRGQDQSASTSPFLEEGEAAETAWAPIWVEDGASGAEIEPAAANESGVDEEMPAMAHPEVEEGCGCGGRSKSRESESSENLEADEGLWEDESEASEAFGAVEIIDQPFAWEDVQDALEAFEDIEASA